MEKHGKQPVEERHRERPADPAQIPARRVLAEDNQKRLEHHHQPEPVAAGTEQRVEADAGGEPWQVVGEEGDVHRGEEHLEAERPPQHLQGEYRVGQQEEAQQETLRAPDGEEHEARPEIELHLDHQ